MSTHETYVIGIDAGGSTTQACLASSNGTILAARQAGTGNVQAIGIEGFVETVSQLVQDLCKAANVPRSAIRRIEIGAAGLDREREKEKVLSALSSTGLAESFGIQADSLIALYAGTMGEPGIVLIAGTGSIADGINACGTRCRVGGWGYLLGDEGSGYAIGRAALQAVARAADGRGRKTRLIQRILSHFQVASPSDLIGAVYHPPLSPRDVAALAVFVGEEAAKGDQPAREILEEAAEELALAVYTVAARLEIAAQPLTVHLAGGLFKMGPPLLDPLKAAIAKYLPLASLSILPNPVIGALMLALRTLGPITPDVRTNLDLSAQTFGLKSECK